MDRLGRFALLLALAVAAYGALAAVVGHRTGRPALVESARRAAYAVFAAALAANGAMLAALLTNDFHLRYVAENSSRATPVFFKALALWGADDGSLLLWNLVLAGYLAALAVRFRRYRPVTFPYALAVAYGVSCFYLALVSGPSRPFATLASAPADGRGPAPLLQNHPLMAVHPPFLYLGFIGFTVPFAFGMASLLTGETSDHWVTLTRRWTLAVWCFLTVGLLLGALWSYSVLGWGGYWAWDPVENVALLPWLTATAFLHSVMLQERRGTARLWNICLVVAAFALTTFGTFLTRGSILASVHTFAQSAVGPMYLGFLVLVLLAGFGLAAWRAHELRTPGRIDSPWSREAAFVGNNVLLLAVTGVVLVGTVFPLFVQATTGRQVAVGAPYFRQATAPALLLLLLLLGAAVLLPWRGGPSARALHRLRRPAIVGGLVVAGAVAAGVRQAGPALGYGLAAMVLVSNAMELGTGLHLTQPRRALRMIARGRRRYGGLIVHVGLAIAAIGIVVSSTAATQTEVSLTRGQSVNFAGYRLTYEGMQQRQEPQRTVLTTEVAVRRDGARVGTLAPRLNLYPAASEPIGTPAIRRGVLRDLYASAIGLDQNGKVATLRFFLNPGVTWLWIGGAIMVVGGLLAVWPDRRRRGRLRGGPSRPGPASQRRRTELAGVGS